MGLVGQFYYSFKIPTNANWFFFFQFFNLHCKKLSKIRMVLFKCVILIHFRLQKNSKRMVEFNQKKVKFETGIMIFPFFIMFFIKSEVLVLCLYFDHGHEFVKVLTA